MIRLQAVCFLIKDTDHLKTIRFFIYLLRLFSLLLLIKLESLVNHFKNKDNFDHP